MTVLMTKTKKNMKGISKSFRFLFEIMIALGLNRIKVCLLPSCMYFHPYLRIKQFNKVAAATTEITIIRKLYF